MLPVFTSQNHAAVASKEKRRETWASTSGSGR